MQQITSDSADRINALIIGKSGIGKTSLIRTIHGAVCVLSAEAGLLSVRDLVKKGQLEGFEVASLVDLREVYSLLATNQEMSERYQWIFIDSLTEIADRCVEAMQNKYPNRADSFKLWGDFTDTLMRLIKGFRDLRQYNVVFTCLETVEKDENNRRYIGPLIQGKALKDKLPSYFDLVLYLAALPDESGQEQRCFITQPLNNFPAKDRSGKLAQIEKPDLNHIKNMILNGG